MQPYNTKRIKDTGIVILAVIGFIAVIALATWGGLQTAGSSNITAAVTNLTALFFPTQEPEIETIAFSAPTQDVAIGTAFTLAWEHDTDTTGTYTFNYACTESAVSFERPGDGDEKIMCNVPYSFAGITQTLTLIPHAQQDATISVELTYTPENSEVRTAYGTTDVSISAPMTSAPSPASISAGVPYVETQSLSNAPVVGVSDPNGTADLMVRIMGIGIIDPGTRTFVSTPGGIPRTAEGAVKFEVHNVGTKTTEVWNFRAELPTSPTYRFRPREDQRVLNPGEYIEYTLSFDRIRRADTGTVRIELDALETTEIEETNNIAEITFLVLE
jgi:hypothetical protein